MVCESLSQAAIIVIVKVVMLKLMTSALISMSVSWKDRAILLPKDVLILLAVIDVFASQDFIELTQFVSISTNVNYPSQGYAVVRGSSSGNMSGTLSG